MQIKTFPLGRTHKGIVRVTVLGDRSLMNQYIINIHSTFAHKLWSIEIIIHLTIFTEQQPHIKRRPNEKRLLSL